MTVELANIFKGICPPTAEPSDKPLYAVMPVPGYASYFVGKDSESLACLLVSTTDRAGRPHPPIRLESLDAQFELHCHLKKANEPEQEGTFTVIRCRDDDSETTRYFLSVCDSLLRVLGDQPTRPSITTTVHRLAAIFQKVRRSPARPLNGLFGELYLLLRSSNAVKALGAWRANENARFDFSNGDVRLDVKTTTGRNRAAHIFVRAVQPSSGDGCRSGPLAAYRADCRRLISLLHY